MSGGRWRYAIVRLQGPQRAEDHSSVKRGASEPQQVRAHCELYVLDTHYTYNIDTF